MNKIFVLASLDLAEDAPISPLRNGTAVEIGTFNIFRNFLLSSFCSFANLSLLRGMVSVPYRMLGKANHFQKVFPISIL